MTCFLIVLIGSFYAGSVSVNTFIAIFVLVAWYLHAASSNDYADRLIDEINLKSDKNRPLVNKTISRRSLWILHILSGIASLLFSLLYGPWALLLTFIVLLLDYAYSFKPIRITDRGILSQLMLPIAYVLFPLSLGYWSVDTSNPYPWLLLAGLYTGFIARLMLKDFRDVKGDKMFGKRTFLLRHGRIATCYISELFGIISLIIMAMVISFSPGALIVLIVGHMLASWLLRVLLKTSNIDHQVKLVKIIAKTANGSVIVILVYYFLSMINADQVIMNVTPLLIGSIWYFYVWISNKDDIQNKFT